ncbi:Bromodomain-containing protein [Fomitiporia mediterranea MF3/22]|uniref:Bromodomain-containing protein n=1 Tax=Fomitiporia mediterranea (strain MF3/22) TaxID=694068 RepID=UPI000440777A|nr:Bromodomain-containing protein [Fomitiporia mediterranea MF3/22]EJD04035.1 Bromodomain-containing protein [Fomitiporia mediterranea MF3/22]
MSDALAVHAATSVNGIHPPLGISTNTNGAQPSSDNIDNGALSSAPDSPVVLSPPTDAVSPAVKIDIDYAQRESDARHEPLTLSLGKTDDVSVQAQLDTPADPASIPIAPPKGTPPPPAGQLLEDVRMAEQATPALSGESPVAEANGSSGMNGVKHEEKNGVNGHAAPSSADDMNVDTPVPPSSRQPDAHDAVLDDASQPPPAKRARKLSDADQASLAHSPAPPPPTTVLSTATEDRSATPSPSQDRKATLSQAQYRFCVSTVRNLRKLKDATPFLNPVDPVALNIPHYLSIVKHPMDFATIDRKLVASNPVKPDSNPANPRYLTADEFIADVRLMFSNAYTFNGPEHVVTQMGKRVEAIFDKQIKQLPPPAEEPKPQAPKKAATPPPPPPPAKKAPAARRPSTSLPTIRRSDTTETARPKREIHPPPPKDLPYAEPSKKMRSVRKAKTDDGTEEQLRYCGKILTDLHKKSLFTIASPFYEPVDAVKLGIPHYPKIVKRPMDLGTMRKKLDNREYPNAAKFKEDFALMIRNCMAFNPVGTAVHDAGVEIQRVFEEKWSHLPPLKVPSEDEDEDEDEDSDDDRIRAIADLEARIETMRGNLAALKNQAKKKVKKEKRPPKRASPPVASTSKPNNRPAKPVPKKKSSKKAQIPDDDVLSFDQKKDLSETIQNLEGEKLERVINIIHEGVPEIRDSSEEIELDIDQLPAPVLLKLYNFVIRPLKANNSKRSRTGTGTGTGGLKRKSMDEDVEAEKIRQLEERMKMFDKNAVVSSGVKHENDSEHSSDDSSSDSSGSDSE